ncbi:MAG: rhomboid family intramembrane serine protease [Bacteroidota bacterium]
MMQNLAPMTRNLLIANLAVFVLHWVMPELRWDFTLYYPLMEEFRPYQLLTHMFTHAPGLGHIFGNMLSLFFFGSVLERTFGSNRFLTFYLICGLGATFLFEGAVALEHYLVASTIDGAQSAVMGASGAVFGILMAFAMLYPNVEIMLLFPPIPIKAKYFVLIYGAYELYATINRFQGDNVAHLAHLGGMLFAFILVKLWKNELRRGY